MNDDVTIVSDTTVPKKSKIKYKLKHSSVCDYYLTSAQSYVIGR